MNALQWLNANHAYVIGIVVGLAMGVFYALDGWNGSKKIIQFKDSARARNLLWVAGGAFMAIFADIRAVTPASATPPDKLDLLFWYLLSAFAGGLLVVLLLSLLVVANNLTNRLARYNYSATAALGDYLHYGYAAYAERKNEVVKAHRDNFHLDYATQLAKTITAADSNTSAQDNLRIAREILRTMAVVVERYRGGRTAKIRANLMLPKALSPDLKAALSFTTPAPACTRCLVLVAYSDDVSRDLVLPLPEPTAANHALPGAPMAFFDDVPYIVDDTRRIPFSASISPQLQAEVQKYFASKETLLMRWSAA
jgi:hypothetical protein